MFIDFFMLLAVEAINMRVDGCICTELLFHGGEQNALHSADWLHDHGEAKNEHANGPKS